MINPRRIAPFLTLPLLFVSFAGAQNPASQPVPPASQPAPYLESGPGAWVDRVYDLLHLELNLWFDLEKQTVRGTATHTLKPLFDGAVELPFDAEEMRVTAAVVQGAAAAVRNDEKRVFIKLNKPAKAGEEIEVSLQYEAWPTTGLHWGAPEEGYKWKWYQCYSQGQSENNHHWIPMHDYPNDRATLSCTLHVDRQLTAVANGRLVDIKNDPDGGTHAFHYELEQPNATYLFSVAIGPWEKYTDIWRGIPVEYYVGPGVGEARARRSFGKTPAMLEFFSEWIGTPYPYAKYSQTAVMEFVTGGMENVSATTQSDTTLHDERAHLERDSDGLVAHELAHQWWGDMLTCNGWRHLWLNEGFATYFTALWTEHEKGLDGYRLYMDGQRRGFLSADSEESPRALVTTAWSRRGDGANAHVYTKGSSVLHMLRFIIGDELFKKSLATWAAQYRYQLVETRDLERVVAEVTGRGLEWFWQEWAYMQGAPSIDFQDAFDAETKTLTLTIRQIQKVTPTTPVFKMPVDVYIGYENGSGDVKRIWIDAAENSYKFALAARPAFVHFDEGAWLAARVKHEQSAAALMAMAQRDPDVTGRRDACTALAKKLKAADNTIAPAIIRCLFDIIKSADHKDVRAAATAALKELECDGARDALIAALRSEEVSVRRTAAEALGKFTKEKNITIMENLKLLCNSDPAYGVQIAALRSLAAVAGADAWDTATGMMNFESERDTVRAGVLDVIQKLDAKKALPFLFNSAAVGKTYELRQTALNLLINILRDEKRPDALDAAARAQLSTLVQAAAQSNNYKLRIPAIGHLGRLTDPESAALLTKIKNGSRDGRDRSASEAALKARSEKAAK